MLDRSPQKHKNVSNNPNAHYFPALGPLKVVEN